MLSIIGYIVVLGAVAGGYLMGGGSLHVLWQPAELVIIFGAALGAFVASSTNYAFKQSIKNLPTILSPKVASKATYLQTLALMHSIFSKMHREGIISIEKDIEDPKSSSLFQSFPLVAKDLQACNFIGDTLRTFLTTGKADELGELMDIDAESVKEEMSIAPEAIAHMAESLPGMGIVAAVLGVVLTMGMISEPPEVLGHHIGAALTGTFLGILLCYGIFAPIAAKLANIKAERMMYFKCIREAVMGALHGLSPMVALEYGRRSIPPTYRPSFAEMEQSLKG